MNSKQKVFLIILFSLALIGLIKLILTNPFQLIFTVLITVLLIFVIVRYGLRPTYVRSKNIKRRPTTQKRKPSHSLRVIEGKKNKR